MPRSTWDFLTRWGTNASQENVLLHAVNKLCIYCQLVSTVGYYLVASFLIQSAKQPIEILFFIWSLLVCLLFGVGWLVVWLIDCLVSSLFGWFVLSCLIGCLVGWSVGCLDGRFVLLFIGSCLHSSFFPFFPWLSGFLVFGWFLACLLGYLVSQKVIQVAGYKTNNYIIFIYYKPMNYCTYKLRWK